MEEEEEAAAAAAATTCSNFPPLSVSHSAVRAIFSPPFLSLAFDHKCCRRRPLPSLLGKKASVIGSAAAAVGRTFFSASVIAAVA